MSISYSINYPKRSHPLPQSPFPKAEAVGKAIALTNALCAFPFFLIQIHVTATKYLRGKILWWTKCLA
ncbi:MAG: hypothetical protein WBG73_17395 [Coleofasciculaceae cyanobacterium]